jgi:hypothetical protein
MRAIVVRIPAAWHQFQTSQAESHNRIFQIICRLWMKRINDGEAH